MPLGPSRLKKMILKIQESNPYQAAKGIFNFRSSHSHNSKENYGHAGEVTVQKYLKENEIFAVFERLSPQKEINMPVREIDAIIYDRGVFCCVEIKRYKGVIQFHSPRQPYKGKNSSLTDQQVPPFEKWSSILVTKQGNYGEGEFKKIHKNPKLRVKSYIYHFKNYLNGIRSTLAKENFQNLLVFIRGDSDITSIHSIEDGIIYHDEIREYIDLKSRYNSSKLDIETIKSSLLSLPTWDTITTRDGQEYYGLLKRDAFKFSLNESESIVVPFSSTNQIVIKHKSRFSPDELEFLAEGKINNFKIRSSWIPLYRFDDTDQFKTNSIDKVILGANPLRTKKTILTV